MHPHHRGQYNPYGAAPNHPQHGGGHNQGQPPAIQPVVVVHPPYQGVPQPPHPVQQGLQYFMQPGFPQQPMPQPVAAMQGPQPILFLPHRFFQSSDAQVRLGQGHMPVSAQDGQQFPFPDPPRLFRSRLPTSLRCKELRHAPLSSDCVQTTSVPTAVQGLPGVDRLTQLRCSDALWNNLVEYASETGGLAPPPQLAAHLAAVNTWSLGALASGTGVAERLQLAPGWQQAKAVYGLSGWFSEHMHRPDTVVVNSEPAVQDEVRSQILEPLNLLLQTRCRNRIHDALDPGKHWTLPAGQLANAPDSAFYPTWTRSCHASHPEAGRGRAGFPDFILHTNAAKLSNTAVIETKFFSTFMDSHLQKIYRQDIYNNHTNQFAWNANSLQSKLVRQIWGQLHFFRAQWGFCTNGSMVFAFVNTGQGELTVSPLKSWSDPTVHKALSGLVFASIDDRNIPGNWGISLCDLICPANSRRAVWE
ncbi:hypothetical protein NM688_g753 [Phlebia brevispora]|uniref:Uncharacterized protein n=1 Tax=Phlebia brevispora TaxID=194682 RepID=A0ACC1TDM2_9APHY|nr:hypothetical protein NM688_g753 [Phlebia brevispora]